MNKATKMLNKTKADKEETPTKDENKLIKNKALALVGGGVAGGIVSGAKSKFFEDGLHKDIASFEKKHRMKFSTAEKSKLIKNKHIKSIAIGAGASLLASIMNSRLSMKETEAKKNRERSN